MKEGDLTNAAGWETMWRRGGGGVRARVSAALARDYDAVMSGILDSAAHGEAIDVLELGCAPGTMIEMMHRLRPQHRYGGVDIALESLGPTRDRVAAGGCDVTLWAGDLRDIVLPRRFQLVVSIGLIEHFDDPAEVIRHHARLAAPGGMVAVTVPNYAHPLVARLLARVSPETLATHNLAIMSKPAIRDALVAAGLGDIRVGGATGPILPVSRPRAGAVGAVYATAARAWNLTTGFLPDGLRPWNGMLWGTGIVS